MRVGQRVEVSEAFDSKAVKRVVSADQNYVYVCREDEYADANRQGREPVSIGFRREFVTRVINEGE